MLITTEPPQQPRFFFIDVYVCHVCTLVSSAQKRVLGPLNLEFRGAQNWGPLKEQYALFCFVFFLRQGFSVYL